MNRFAVVALSLLVVLPSLGQDYAKDDLKVLKQEFQKWEPPRVLEGELPTGKMIGRFYGLVYSKEGRETGISLLTLRSHKKNLFSVTIVDAAGNSIHQELSSSFAICTKEEGNLLVPIIHKQNKLSQSVLVYKIFENDIVVHDRSTGFALKYYHKKLDLSVPVNVKLRQSSKRFRYGDQGNIPEKVKRINIPRKLSGLLFPPK